jgi:hypothetical protein
MLTRALKGLQNSRGAAGVLFFVGLGGALWAAGGRSSLLVDWNTGQPLVVCEWPKGGRAVPSHR